jgi:hypothetical protein
MRAGHGGANITVVPDEKRTIDHAKPSYMRAVPPATGWEVIGP